MAREHLAAQLDGLSSPVNGSGRKTMAKMDVRKADEGDLRVEIGRAVRLTRGTLSLKEFAGGDRSGRAADCAMGRGEGTPARRCDLRGARVSARVHRGARGLDDDVQVQTVITIRRTGLMRRDLFVYISGPMTAKDGHSIEENVAAGVRVYLDSLARAGLRGVDPEANHLFAG
jgi:hypothetical protein